jgi:hypothetical protein
MESVLIVFNKTHRPLPPRLTSSDLASATIIPVSGGSTSPPSPPIHSHTDGKLTLSPVSAMPFEGICDVPDDVDLTKARIYLEMETLKPEEAARVTINGRDAGGLIGRPLRLEVTHWLRPGPNTIGISPFAPRLARLIVFDDGDKP